jgi:hypothetical protein
VRAGLAGTITLLPFTLPRFPDMLVSPLGFPARWVGCPRRLFALNLLPILGYLMCAETAQYDVPYNCKICVHSAPLMTFEPLVQNLLVSLFASMSF